MSVLKLFSSGKDGLGSVGRRHSPSLSERESNEAWKGFTFTLGPGLLLGFSLGSLVILAWVFVFGVIVGRGLNPETQMPGASIMSQCDPKPEILKPEILKPEELTFLNELKQPGGRRLPLPATKTDKPQENAAATQETPSPSPPPPPPAAPIKPVPAEPTYSYVFQVAAYKTKEPANLLRKKLESVGLRSTLLGGKGQKRSLYRVQIAVRGGENLGAEIKSKLAQVGVTDAVIISRRPIGTSVAQESKPAASAAKPPAQAAVSVQRTAPQPAPKSTKGPVGR